MRLLSTLALTLTLGLSLVTMDAEARRLGGSKSFGTQRQVTTQKATTQKAPETASAATTAKSNRSWMGPIAGLAAGLGLAALASHLGFGEEMASMLLFGLLAMAVMALIGWVMRKRAVAQQSGAGGIGGMQYARAGGTPSAPAPHSYDALMPGSVAGSVIGAQVGSTNVPADFDVTGFVRSAKVQFIRLQAANDAGNLDDIRQFTTPEMFAELKMDISERGGAGQYTEVVGVEAEVIEVAEDNDHYRVSVRFTGLIREERDAPAVSFDEVWHLEKPRNSQGGWVLAGIQQMQ